MLKIKISEKVGSSIIQEDGMYIMVGPKIVGKIELPKENKKRKRANYIIDGGVYIVVVS